jgi:hypothetical protein
MRMIQDFCGVEDTFAARVRQPFVAQSNDAFDKSIFSLQDCKTLRRIMRCIEHVTQSDQMALYDWVFNFSSFSFLSLSYLNLF